MAAVPSRSTRGDEPEQPGPDETRTEERPGDRSRRPARRGAAERPGRGARPEPPDRPARAERRARPERPERPARPERPERPARAERPARPPRPERPLRADARRNRDALLQVAAAAFAEDGEAPLETIAQRAGVGIGTLYRHFPTRGALVEAAYRQEVEELCATATALLDGSAAEDGRTGIEALREWMGRFAGYAAAKRGMGGALRSAVGSDSPLFGETRARIVAAIDELLAAGRADGSVRADADGEQVMLALGAVWLVPLSDAWAEQVRGVLGLVVDGLRYGAGGTPA